MSEFDPIYIPYGGALEDAISNKERRYLRGRSPHERLGAARRAQSSSGLQVRIYRPVSNQKAFLPELDVWVDPVKDGVANRRSLGNLALTVFDTNQQPLESCDDYTQASLADRLTIRRPSLFQVTKPVEVTGLDLFGSEKRPFIGLTLAPGDLHEERLAVRGIVAPGLALDDRHQLDHRLHISLGQVFSAERAHELMGQLESVIPDFVKFEGADVKVSNSHSQ